MAFEELPSSSLEHEPTNVRGRRVAVLVGVALVWAAFMASLGLLLIALLVLVAAAVAAMWILGPRLPRPHLGSAARGVGERLRTGGAAASRYASIGGRRAVSASRAAGATTSRHLGTARRAGAKRLSGAPALASGVIDRTTKAIRASAPSVSRRRRDPRVEQALASNSQGIALAKAGKAAEAIDAFDTALALLADAGDRHHEGRVLVNLGVVHHHVGGDEAARFCWSKALERLEPGTPESERTAELLGAR
jgi:tetratricopeptide (TPR) repeat protein